ncbi:peptidase, M50 family protein [Flavobacterium sp.]|jgi:putative peptide zinc metalloprotease protein|uniref:peptidase, M50 family protein n=1 Tax=Flavobacterium sp. TaxID=239 RepID=UPI0037C14602
MKKFIIPQISPDITIHQLNKRDFFIHQTIFDYRIKISSELSNFISLIDNKKSLEEIIEEYNKVYHVKLPYDFAFQFLFTKLASYGIILNGTAGVFPNQKPNYLKLSFIVFSEQRVSILSQKLHFLFAKKNIVIVIILSFIIGFYSLSNYNIYHTAISTSNWISFFILSFLSVTMHEFGHASAAHHYGAKHGGIGGGFYLLMPVYFADVTDIWKLSKAQRIVVNFAGIYFELIFVILIILTGLFLNMTEMLVFGYLILLSSLRNLNPFIRSDGYWILSDTIEKPNLMYHSLNKLISFYCFMV